MVTTTASEARKLLFPLIEQVNDDREPVTITSRKGNAVLIAEDEYRSLQETAHLLRSPRNARRLLDAMEELRSGGGQPRELDPE